MEPTKVTYADLEEMARQLLGHAGKFTLLEQEQLEEGGYDQPVSANECLGMATRVLAEQAKVLQKMADDAEKK